MNSRHSISRLRTVLFNGIYDMDEQHRALACDHIASVLRSWASHIQEEEARIISKQISVEEDSFEIISQKRLKSSHSGGNGGLASGHQVMDDQLADIQSHLQYHLLVVLRMSVNCPFDNVRFKFRTFLADLKALGVKIPQPANSGPTFFINKDKLVSLETDNHVTQKLMAQCFLLNGRFSHVYRLMAYFPGYLEKSMETFNQILRYQGPLPRTWRNYIAIMAACQHNCQYLVSLQTREFLLNGGDAEWLISLKNAPLKLQNLSTVNTLMAHQPWLLRKSHMKALSKGSDSWSMSELVQAIVIFATFHSLSSFVLGCGVAPEIDMAGGTVDDAESLPSPDEAAHENDPDLVQQTTELINRLLQKDNFDNSDETPLKVVFETCESEETFKGRQRDESSAIIVESSPNIVLEDLQRFLGDDEVKYSDFDIKSKEYSVFRLQDYNWEEHGCSLIGKYLGELGDGLDEEFNSILNLTDYSLFNTNENRTEIDTWPFRQAIWYYVLRLSGMSHDDYNYHEVNIYLNKRIKQYIKKVACTPETIVTSDFHKMGFTFRPDEKVQINLLASEARKCAELLYAIKCVSDESQ